MTAKEDDFVFFYGGFFSQWFIVDLEIDGVTYNCAEQYMMAMKAKTFNDDESFKKIMESTKPQTQKALGRKVTNFDPNIWSKVSKDFVYRANLVKFSKKPLRDFILSTGDKEIVEASPTDVIWGIGIGMDDPRRFDKNQWRGENCLGDILMAVREYIVLSNC